MAKFIVSADLIKKVQVEYEIEAGSPAEAADLVNVGGGRLLDADVKEDEFDNCDVRVVTDENGREFWL